MIVKFHPGKHSFRNGASNACVYTKATAQAMPLFPQTRKITRTAVADRVVFLLVEAPAPSPGEHEVFWYAVPQTAATRFLESL